MTEGEMGPSANGGPLSNADVLEQLQQNGSAEAGAATAQPPSADDIEAADRHRAEGNKAFKEKHYPAAILAYTKAIQAAPSAPLFSNRAFSHMRLENYGSAVADATRALELDSRFVKAYYRRGDAYFGLGRFKQAVRDFRLAAKVAPRDPDLKRKLAECEKEVRRIRFEEAVASPDVVQVSVAEQLDLTTITVEDGYKGPRMQGSDREGYTLTLQFVKDMLEHFRAQKLIHKRFAFQIVFWAFEHFKALPTLVDVPVADEASITVCGDVHGQFYDLLNIFELNGLPGPDNPYLFNGDFVDRGSFAAEVILTLLAFKVLYPQHMHMARGNHESKGMNKIYGFEGEIRQKYSPRLAELFTETFCWLPLAHRLAGKVLVVHGGLFAQDGVMLDDIRRIDRNREPPEDGLMCEMLWSDPQPAPGRSPSKRGVGVGFGPDVTRRFLQDNDLQLLVRSHEVKEEGYHVEHDGYCVTVFSAPNYCDSMGNKGAFVRFTAPDMVPHFTKFEAVKHPDIKPMAYASALMRGGMFGM